MSFITFTLRILEEKRPGSGEDALACQTMASDAAFIACMDGCGGSGGSRYPRFANWTGARIASHLAGKAVSEWFENRTVSGKASTKMSAEYMAEDLAAFLKLRFHQAAGKLDEGDKISFSRLSKLFPTTLAAMLMEAVGRNRCRIRSFWAGDSRTYYFPITGLQQTSRDNTRGDIDPFDDLIRDGIMNNVICADNPFRVCCSEVLAEDPCMVLTATDGCFSYYVSPICLEWILLDSLQNAENPAAWERDLKKQIGEVSGDDYTLVLAVIGFQNFTALKKAYAPRWIFFQSHYAERLQTVLAQGNVEAHRALWGEYKKGYMPEILYNSENE